MGRSDEIGDVVNLSKRGRSFWKEQSLEMEKDITLRWIGDYHVLSRLLKIVESEGEQSGQRTRGSREYVPTSPIFSTYTSSDSEKKKKMSCCPRTSCQLARPVVTQPLQNAP